MATKRKSSRKKKSSFNWKVSILFLILLAISLIAVYYFTQKKAHKLSKEELVVSVPEGFASIGIDVSHHQGKINWDLLFNELRYDTLIRFVYCKATESLTHVDTQWEQNRSALNNLGIVNGAYHFFDPKNPPREQAAHFLAHWKFREIDLPPVLDVETEGFSDTDLIAKMKIWLKVIEEQSGMRPIIYTSSSFYSKKFRNNFPGYFFWVAGYSRRPENLDDKQVLHWQFSETGSLPGIRELVDLNVSKVAF